MSEKPVRLTEPPASYAAWLTELKIRIHTAQQRATLAVNRELVLLYWKIGRDILARQAEQGWGAKVIERLAEIRKDIPVVIHCRSGSRSAAVANALGVRYGFSNISSLQGGILAFGQAFDPTLKCD